MAFGAKSPGRIVATLTCAVLLVAAICAAPVSAQIPDLVVEVGDTTAAPGAQNTVISVFMSNFADTVAGFKLYIQLDRPDIMVFQTDTATVIDTSYWLCNAWQVDGDDSTCLEPVLSDPLDYDFTTIDTNQITIGSWDSTGALISGWQSVDARSLSGLGTDLNVVGIANMPGGDTVSGIPPQQGGVLVRLLADVLTIPDTLSERTVNVLVQDQSTSLFQFSRPDGSLIASKDSAYVDTNLWLCTAWAGDVCLNWKRVSEPPADSMVILEDTIAVLDYDKFLTYNGSLTILEGVCGDVNGSGGEPNVADLSFLVDFLFRGGVAPSPLWVGDMNCSGAEPNVADLSYLVDYLFRGGPAPCSGPDC